MYYNNRVTDNVALLFFYLWKEFYLKTKAGIASMVLGIVGTALVFMTGIMGPVSIVLGIIGIILSVVGFSAIKNGKSGKGMTIAGLVTSIVSVVFGIYFTLMLAALVGVSTAAVDALASYDYSADTAITENYDY